MPKNDTNPVGPPPNDLFMGCNVERRSVVIFFDFLLLLVFELGQDVFAPPCSCILTNTPNSCCYFNRQEGVQGSYAVSFVSGSIIILNESAAVYLGTPLLRVIYRDSKSSEHRRSLARSSSIDAPVRHLFFRRLIR